MHRVKVIVDLIRVYRCTSAVAKGYNTHPSHFVGLDSCVGGVKFFVSDSHLTRSNAFYGRF